MSPVTIGASFYAGTQVPGASKLLRKNGVRARKMIPGVAPGHVRAVRKSLCSSLRLP